ncbi:MAG: family 43 glycosylhydrolase [Acidobacterium ailaaui]|nr:family 43 glycosylhydrolase [Pseudacidobacterium ailaaui]
MVAFRNVIFSKKYFLFVYLIFLLCDISCNSIKSVKNDHASHASVTTTNSDTTWVLLPFQKVDSLNPVLGPSNQTFFDPIRKKKIAWEAKDVFNPTVIVKNDKIYMLYRAEDSVGKPNGTSRIGLAVSTDGFHFKRFPSPVLYPENDSFKKYEWQGGCEDPRVVQDSAGVYYMTYTAYDGKIARLFIATSKDLVHWKKHGSVFNKAYHGTFLNKWSKSGAIVSVYKNGTPVAVKINGKYWMYWGDQFIWAATSDDLINWTPIKMQPGEKPPVALRNQAITMPDLKIIVPTRLGKFDNDIVESGPPAMLTSHGILLIYNGRNTTEGGNSALANGTYSGGEVLLDKNDPTKIIHRLNHYFITPTQPYEITGQVNYVCFLEGLVHFKNKWFLYYGTADSKIAVAVCDKNIF